MPSYEYKSSGTNSQVCPLHVASSDVDNTNAQQGNHYCARDYGSGASNSNAYHYSNSYVYPCL